MEGIMSKKLFIPGPIDVNEDVLAQMANQVISHRGSEASALQEAITEKLNYHNYMAVGIFGRMIKEDRKNALNAFRIGKAKILVSSDLSARGLDIVDITHVFNLDFPASKNEYVHRSGRTARGNRTGDTISIVTNQNLSTIRDYKKEFNIDIKPKELKEGKLIDSFNHQNKAKKKK